jgi:hypothetical protein
MLGAAKHLLHLRRNEPSRFFAEFALGLLRFARYGLFTSFRAVGERRANSLP